jgi:hypothetical protein
MELWSQGLSMDHDWVLAFDVEDADLKQHPVRCWANKHRQVVVEKNSSHRIANGMPCVRLGDPVLSRWLADPGLDNIACLADDIVGHARQRLPAITKQSQRRLGLLGLSSTPTHLWFAKTPEVTGDAGSPE